MFTIGLVGGVASGKSTVAAMFAELGAVVISADRMAHDVLAQPDVVDQLVARWGDSILAADGSVNRSAIARLVFGDAPEAEEERHYLESVVHPLTRLAVEGKRERLAAQGQEVFVIDAPLLLEAGWDATCNTILMVDTPDEHRAANAVRRGWTTEEIDRREEAQLPLEIKRHRSDVVIDNSGDLNETREQVRIFWREVVVPQLGD
ncbi:dephospho-CoA kinase [Aeoliella sp.]|uniref:dephospho-CoA kinase n=1 Tax=Aeoliella sp. TaxID=2795800 RepID=UPI003CCBF3BB